MLKYAGIFAIASAIAAFGAIKASSIKQKSEIRKEIIRFISHIESCINFGTAPLCDIYCSFNSELFEKCGFKKLIASGFINQASIKNALSELSKDEIYTLSEFFSNIGTSFSRQEEIRLCKYYLSAFETFYEENIKTDNSKASLYKKLGIICALMTAIILI